MDNIRSSVALDTLAQYDVNVEAHAQNKMNCTVREMVVDNMKRLLNQDGIAFNEEEVALVDVPMQDNN